MGMLSIYKVYSEAISHQVSVVGMSATHDPIMKTLKVLRKNILRLISIFMKNATNYTLITTHFAPPLQDLMNDYENGHPDARDPEVVLLFSTMVECLKNAVISGVEAILRKLGVSTLAMIGADYQCYPEHRLNYFILLKNIVAHCFESLFLLGPEQFKTVIDSLLYAIKHQEPNISEIGLQALLGLINTLSQNSEALNSFFSIYLMEIIKCIFFVLTDSLHKSGFKLQTEILKKLMLAIELRAITAPIDPNVPDNKMYVGEFLVSALSTSFPNIAKSNVTSFIESLFSNSNNWEKFKTSLRDFLITMKEFAEDADLLYSEEKLKVEEERRQLEEMKKQAILSRFAQETPK